MSTSPLPSTRHTVTRGGLRKRRALRRFAYSQLALRSALMVALGREAPLVRFTVEADPPSVYWVFRLRPDVVDSLPERLSLPPGYASTPLRALPDDEPAHLLTLNAYRVSGITNALRAEWSIYVEDPDTGVPRYLVIDPRSSTRSMDPVDVFTPASRVEHGIIGDELVTDIGPEATSFSSRLTLHPDHHELPSVACAPEWVSANDRIFWGNGICDRTFYDAGLAQPSMVRMADDAAGADHIVDRSPWADLVEPEPVHVLVFREAIEFIVSPWSNIDDLKS